MSGNNPPEGQNGPYGQGQPQNPPPGGYGQQSGGSGYGQPGGYGGPPQNQGYSGPYGGAAGSPGTPAYQGPGQPGQGNPGQGYQQPPGQGYPRPPGQGGPGQPGPGGSGYGGQPMGPGGQPPAGKKSNSKLFIILGAAALALIILAVGIGLLLTSGKDEPIAGTPGDPSAPSSAPANATKASDAVKGYLDALAAGNATTALGYGEDVPADKTFLSDDVLKKSNERAPITDINVPEVADDNAYQVDASYKIGEDSINEKFYVSKTGSGWKVKQSFAELNLTYSRAKTVPMFINGVAVKTDKVKIFPGAYEFTSGNKFIGYGDDNVLVQKSPSDYAAATDIKPTLSDAGEKAFVTAAKAAVTACLKVQKLEPPNCPQSITKSDSQTVDAPSIKWTLKGDPFANLKPRLDYENPARAEASGSFQFLFKATGESYGSATRYSDTDYAYVQMAATMTGETVKIAFED